MPWARISSWNSTCADAGPITEPHDEMSVRSVSMRLNIRCSSACESNRRVCISNKFPRIIFSRVLSPSILLDEISTCAFFHVRVTSTSFTALNASEISSRMVSSVADIHTPRSSDTLPVCESKNCTRCSSNSDFASEFPVTLCIACVSSCSNCSINPVLFATALSCTSTCDAAAQFVHGRHSPPDSKCPKAHLQSLAVGDVGDDIRFEPQ